MERTVRSVAVHRRRVPRRASDPPFCGESGWTAAAGISRRYSAGTFRPSVVVTRQVALAVPIHPHRMVPVSWSYFLGAGTAVSVSGHRASRAGGHRGRSRGQHGAWRSTSAAQAVRWASRYATFDAGGHNLSPRTAPIVAGRGAAVAGLWGTSPASPGTAHRGRGSFESLVGYGTPAASGRATAARLAVDSLLVGRD
jgi:hypothetical protein